METLVGKQLGNYQIVELIGRGGMAAVYKGYQPSMNRHVAIKVLSPQYSSDRAFVQRFQNEARLIAQLEHAHILPVYDFGQQEGMLYIVMRYLPTGTLEDRIPPQGMPLDEVLRILKQVANALDYAHSRGVIHRDLKPANVLIDAQGNTFLSDFGIAKTTEQETTGLTGTGNVIGTPNYMSPEQGLGEKVDARSDIYALGVMLFEMLTGQVPFSGENPMAVMLRHVHDVPPDPGSLRPDLPQAVSNVVLRALAKRPDERYQSAGELAHALEQALSGEAVPSLETMPLTAATRPLAGPAATMPSPVSAAPQPDTAVPGQAIAPTAPAGSPAVGMPPTQAAAIPAPGEIQITLNALSAWLAKREALGVWIQALALSGATWVILQRLTQGAALETALLSLIPGLLLYGLLGAPTVGALLSLILILVPLMAHAPGLALIWVVLILIAGSRLNSREMMLILITLVMAGTPLGWGLALLAPWWLRVRRAVLPLAIGSALAMLFALTLHWPTAGGLLPVVPVPPAAQQGMFFGHFDTTYLGLFEDPRIWARWGNGPLLWESVRTTFEVIGRTLALTGGYPLAAAVVWALAAVASVSNAQVNSPVLRALGLPLGYGVLLGVHLLARPEVVTRIPPLTIALTLTGLVLAFLLTQWPVQADPAKGNKAGTVLRLLRQSLGALYIALGMGIFARLLADSPTFLAFWIGSVLGVLTLITNPLLGPLLAFLGLAAGLAPERPVLAAIVGGLLVFYLLVSFFFDRRRPRSWNPLGAGLLIGAPGLAAAGLLPLGVLSLGTLEAQVPAALLALASHVLLVAVTPHINAVAAAIQVVTTLGGLLVVERLMGLSWLSGLNHKLRRLVLTVGAALPMALIYYTLGRAAPVRLLPQALVLSALTAAAFVFALGDRAMFWRRFLEPEEEEVGGIREDEEVIGPPAQRQR